MQGFPPPAAQQVTLANWREPPFSQWAFHHVRNLTPTAAIRTVSTGGEALPAKHRGLGDLTFSHGQHSSLSVAQMLELTATDGFLVVHQGANIFEHYAHGLDESTPHVLFSVSKSVTGSLAGIAVERGLLDPDALVNRYVPEVQGSAYADASVRQVLDMTVGVAFVEDYQDTEGDMIRYRIASGWHPHPPGWPMMDLRSFITTLPKQGQHGEAFRYRSPNSDLLGWILERATGCAFADLLSQWVWAPMAAEHDAYISVDRLGAPRSAGGICTTLRDFGRFGMLMLNQGMAGGDPLIPRAWIEDIWKTADSDSWIKGEFAGTLPNYRYRSQWYQVGNANRAICGLGVYGQILYIDPTADLVIAKFSSQSVAVDDPLDALCFAAFAAITDALS